MRALSGEIHWFRAADILGVEVRDYLPVAGGGRAQGAVTGSSTGAARLPVAAPGSCAWEPERILRLYRERYRGFNVRHFHHLLPGATTHVQRWSYTWVKHALQAAGLVPKKRPSRAASPPARGAGVLRGAPPHRRQHRCVAAPGARRAADVDRGAR